MTDVNSSDDLTVWKIHGERLVDGTRKMAVSIASVELPDGVQFEQYVFRSPKVAMVVALNNRNEVLMLWRHRFVIDQWTWELPGGYVDDGETPIQAAHRELIEEAGWRANSLTCIARFQPLAGSLDMENLVFLAEDVEPAGVAPDVNEAAKVSWISLSAVQQLIDDGEIIEAGAQIALHRVLRLRGL